MEVARLGLGCCYFDQIEYFLKKKITLRQQEAQKCGFRAKFAIRGPLEQNLTERLILDLF